MKRIVPAKEVLGEGQPLQDILERGTPVEELGRLDLQTLEGYASHLEDGESVDGLLIYIPGVALDDVLGPEEIDED